MIEMMPENMLDDSGYYLARRVGGAENMSNSAMNFLNFRISSMTRLLFSQYYNKKCVILVDHIYSHFLSLPKIKHFGRVQDIQY